MVEKILTNEAQHAVILHSLQNENLQEFRKNFLDLHPYDQASFLRKWRSKKELKFLNI